MRYKASTLRIIEKLKELYPEGLCSLQYEKDYELLFAVRLSAQCTDARVNLVTPALFTRFPTLEAFAAADPTEVGEYIHSCGFYNGKSKDLVGCAQQRLGTTDGSKDPVKVEQQLRKAIPPAESGPFCHRMVLFGRDVCTARSPKCEDCPLKADCAQGKKLK